MDSVSPRSEQHREAVLKTALEFIDHHPGLAGHHRREELETWLGVALAPTADGHIAATADRASQANAEVFGFDGDKHSTLADRQFAKFAGAILRIAARRTPMNN